MLHACVQRFDVTGNLEKFYKILATKQALGCSTEVAFCRVGVDSAWTLLDTKLEFSVGSIVHCQDKFLAIDCTEEISVCSSNAAGATPTATLLPSLATCGALPP